MKTKTLFIIAALLLIGFNADAQLGLTRIGKLQNAAGVCPYYYPYTMTIDCFLSYYDDEILRVEYLPKTQAVAVMDVTTTYNSFKDEFEPHGWSMHIVYYDTLGNITFITSTIYENDSLKWDTTAFNYSEGKLLSIMNSRPKKSFSLRYDQNGNLSKMVRDDNEIWRFTWSPQGYLSTIKQYSNGESCSSYLKYEVTQNGRNVVETRIYDGGSEPAIQTKVFDSHGGMTKHIFNLLYTEDTKLVTKKVINLYENKYDDNRNIIQHLPYKMVGGEKQYGPTASDYGHFYEYEYKFYE